MIWGGTQTYDQNYGKAFISEQTISLVPYSNSTSGWHVCFATVLTADTTKFKAYISNTNASSGNSGYRWIAIGRWK